MLTELERKELARNIRHRLADMFGNQYKGALDAAMDDMLLDEIDKFFLKQGAETPFREGFGEDDDDVSCQDTENDGTTA